MRGPRFSAAGLWVAAIAGAGAGRSRDNRQDCGDAGLRIAGRAGGCRREVEGTACGTAWRA
jgi:hypothetical protein